MSRARSTLLWSLIGALALLLAGLLLILAYPKVVTGDFYEVTVASLEIDAEGRANILFHERVSYQTKVVEGFATNGKTLAYRWVDSNGFLGRPKAGTAAGGFPLLSVNELRRGIKYSSEHRKRLYLQEGKTYVLRDRERFVYFRVTESDGSVNENYFEVNPSP